MTKTIKNENILEFEGVTYHAQEIDAEMKILNTLISACDGCEIEKLEAYQNLKCPTHPIAAVIIEKTTKILFGYCPRKVIRKCACYKLLTQKTMFPLALSLSACLCANWTN